MLGSTRLFPGYIGHEPALSPPEARIPVCPVCGAETWELVRDRWGEAVGCPGCVEVTDASDGSEHTLGYYARGGL